MVGVYVNQRRSVLGTVTCWDFTVARLLDVHVVSQA